LNPKPLNPKCYTLNQVILVADGTGKGMPHPANIFWAMAGYLDAGTTSHLEGVFLVKTKAVFKTHSSLHGRIFAQTVHPTTETLNPKPVSLIPKP
jgi:hypothetical protein